MCYRIKAASHTPVRASDMLKRQKATQAPATITIHGLNKYNTAGGLLSDPSSRRGADKRRPAV